MTNSGCAKWRCRPCILAGVLMALLVLGLFIAGRLRGLGELRAREHVAMAASAAAASFDTRQIGALTASTIDTNTSEYSSIEKQLARIRQSDDRFRYVYLMGLRDGQIVFLAHDEPSAPDEPDAPGKPYPEASAEFKKAFETGQTFVEGPLKDRWGEWVSGLAAIKDPDTGAAAALLGIDIDAEVWREEMDAYRWLGDLVAASLVVIGLGFMLYIGRVSSLNTRLCEEVAERTRAQAELEQAHAELTASEAELKSILRNTPDVIYRLDADGRIVYISDAIRLYGYDPQKLLGSSILDMVHPDDLDKARHRLNERRTGERSVKRLEVRVLASDQTVISAESIAVGVRDESVFLFNAEGLYRTDKPLTESFVGTQGVARDITERRKAEEEIRVLRGIIPICARCKKVRDDAGYWRSVEEYLLEHSEADFSHGLCPDCCEKEMKALEEDEGQAPPS